MKGVNHHQLVKLTPATHENKAQKANKAEGHFSRFKVRIPGTIRQFLSSLFAASPLDVSIRSRDTRPANPAPQQPAANAGGNRQAPQGQHEFSQALEQAKHSDDARNCFSSVSTALEKLQGLKKVMSVVRCNRDSNDYRQCHHDIQNKKLELQQAVEDFNSATGQEGLQLDASTLEMAILNKDNIGNLDFARHDRNYKQYEKMKNALL